LNVAKQRGVERENNTDMSALTRTFYAVLLKDTLMNK